jgi:hypothetical protein
MKFLIYLLVILIAPRNMRTPKGSTRTRNSRILFTLLSLISTIPPTLYTMSSAIIYIINNLSFLNNSLSRD